MQLLGPWCEWGGSRGRGRQWDLLGRSCKVSAFFTSPLRLSDATPSFRMTPQCPPGCLVCRLVSVVSMSSSRSSGIRRPSRPYLVSPTRIRGAPPTRSFIPSGPPGSPRQDPRTILLFPTLPGKHIVLAPGFLCIIIRTCERPRRALWCSSRGMAILSVAHGGTTSHVSCITFGRPLEQTRTICA